MKTIQKAIQTEDNPVPSLRTLLEEFIEKYGKDNYYRTIVTHFIDYVERSNGVETNKEQPITLDKLRYRLTKDSGWYEEGYTGEVTFEDEHVQLEHPTLGAFAWVHLSEIEIIK